MRGLKVNVLKPSLPIAIDLDQVNQFISNVATDNYVQSDTGRNNDSTQRLCFQSLSLARARQSAAQRRQLQDLSSKIGVSLQPIFTSKKIGEIIKTREPKPKISDEQCVVYQFKCGLCKMDYVGLLIDTFFSASTKTPTQDLQLASI